MRLAAATAGVMLLAISFPTAQGGNRDWVFARDMYSRAIAKTDRIVVSLGTSRLPTTGTFFANVKEAGAILQATIGGKVTRTVNGVAETSEASAQFPFGFKAPIGAAGLNTVTLPFQGSPIKGLPLKTADTEFTNLSLEVTMVRLDEAKLWAKIAQRLVTLAQGATLPVSPLGTTVKYALDFANSSLTDALADAGKDQKLALGSRSLNFNVARPVQSGTYLLLLDSTDKGDGYVNPNDLSTVCLYREVSAGDTIKVGRKIANAPDVDTDGCSKASYRTLTNPYVPIILETEVAIAGGPHVMLSAGAGKGQNFTPAKLAHCRMANLDETQCRVVLASSR